MKILAPTLNVYKVIRLLCKLVTFYYQVTMWFPPVIPAIPWVEARTETNSRILWLQSDDCLSKVKRVAQKQVPRLTRVRPKIQPSEPLKLQTKPHKIVFP